MTKESHKVGGLSSRAADRLIKTAEKLNVSTDKVQVLLSNKYNVTFYCDAETLKKIR